MFVRMDMITYCILVQYHRDRYGRAVWLLMLIHHDMFFENGAWYIIPGVNIMRRTLYMLYRDGNKELRLLLN